MCYTIGNLELLIKRIKVANYSVFVVCFSLKHTTARTS